MKPEPLVNAQLHRMNALQRSTESFRYVLLNIELWVSPNGTLREWLKQNLRVGAWLFITALFVMPVVSLILWQLTSWLTMLTTITENLVLVFLLLFTARIIVSFRR